MEGVFRVGDLYVIIGGLEGRTYVKSWGVEEVEVLDFCLKVILSSDDKGCLFWNVFKLKGYLFKRIVLDF